MPHHRESSRLVQVLFLSASIALLACGGGGGSGNGSGSGGGGGGGSGGGNGGGSGGEGGSAGGPVVPPDPPADLVHYVTGNDADADVKPLGPGLILMGGGTDVDEAFVWWKPLLAGGDVVVLRTSGADGYNSYLYQQIGGADSVETLLVTSKALANSEYVKWRVSHAEAVFMSGGDQADYVQFWRGTPLATAIAEVYQRGGVVGGTSAGCAVLGQFLFPAYDGTVYSDEALLDPYNPFMTLEKDYFAFPPLAGLITDTHFVTRDRMGRLIGFLGRILTDGWAPAALGLGIDERTAVVVDAKGQGEVLGLGKAYLVQANNAPTLCTAGKPLEFSGLSFHRLSAGDTLSLPAGTTNVPAEPISASGGVTMPANAY